MLSTKLFRNALQLFWMELSDIDYFFFINRLEIIMPRGNRYLLRFCCTFGNKILGRNFCSDHFFTEYICVIGPQNDILPKFCSHFSPEMLENA